MALIDWYIQNDTEWDGCFVEGLCGVVGFAISIEAVVKSEGTSHPKNEDVRAACGTHRAPMSSVTLDRVHTAHTSQTESSTPIPFPSNPSHPKPMRRTHPLHIQHPTHPPQHPTPTQHRLETVHSLLRRHHQERLQAKRGYHLRLTSITTHG